MSRKFFISAIVCFSTMVSAISTANADELSKQYDVLINASAMFIEIDKKVVASVPSETMLMTSSNKESLVKIILNLKDIIEANASHIKTLTDVLELTRK